MRLRNVIFLVTALLLVLFGCMLNNPLQNQTSTVEVLLTDKPVSDVDKLLVHIVEFSYHYSYEDASGNEIGVWATPTNVATIVDILSLAGTEVSWLTVDIPTPATITQLRFYIDNATVTVSGVDYPVTIPNPEVKIPLINIFVSDSGQLILDFDVLKSLNYVPGTGEYRLKPVFRPTFRRGEVYKISGLVTESSMPVTSAYVALFDTNESTVLRTTLTKSDGHFCLGKWKNGDYVIKVYKITDLGTNITNISEDASQTVTINGEDAFVTIDIPTI
ncbi:DUF4382 domain-containing protein [Thermosipho atlanticus]|uniref:Carboxypeptidase regulatory-like domain-containing protein n=1 Tax=Thermosipho atlanticus DSM 15807 TaxID=1123380 RepID=A0A1M5U591_9BACT|nr:DUF4382 domain-containing protein [Thermosipho atlanticus]SHH58134.1 Carboxypeptidase regulatory-like domain-containing protein [Thermosipho atlanticus DSM 15807]